jgi:hypothetical protein
MKYTTKPLPGIEPEYCKEDTPLLDLESTPRLLDEPDRDTPERSTRTEDGRIVADGSVTVRKTVSEASAAPFRLPPPPRQDPSTADWADTIRGNESPHGPHAVADALSAMRQGTAIDGIPAEAIHEAARLFGAAKQASVEAWVEYHQPKDMARASLPPPVDLIVTRPRIFRCCSLCTGLYRWWFVPSQRPLRAYLAAGWIREAHLADARAKAQLTRSVETARPGDLDCGRRISTTEPRNDRGEYGREVKLLPDGRIDFRSGGAAPRRGTTGTLGLKSYTVNRKVQFKDGTTKRVPCQKAASKVRWIKKDGVDLQETVILPLRKTGPKPLFGKALTRAEIQKRYREKKKSQAA